MIKNTEVKCPYCLADVHFSAKDTLNGEPQIRCKFCYGIFAYSLDNRRITYRKNRDFYEILGLEKNSDLSIIKTRYRELAQRFHPDKLPNKESAHEKMQQINYIYSVLKDKDKREQYDLTLNNDDEFNEDAVSDYRPTINIYSVDREVRDSKKTETIIKEGDYIYYTVGMAILGWRLPFGISGYMDIKVQRIFNPDYRDKFENVLRMKLPKEPLFVVAFGVDEMIIYKDDFERTWVSQKTVNKSDIYTVLIFIMIIIALLAFSIFSVYNKYGRILDY